MTRDLEIIVTVRRLPPRSYISNIRMPETTSPDEVSWRRWFNAMLDIQPFVLEEKILRSRRTLVWWPFLNI